MYLDTDPVGLECIIVLLMIIINGLLVMAEIAVVSSRRTRLETYLAEGKRGAKAAMALLNDAGRLQAMVQFATTSIGVLAGVFGGATLAMFLASYLSGAAIFPVYSKPIGLVVTVLIITFMLLIIGEMIPKKVALNSPESIACFVAGPIWFLVRLTWPIVKVFSFFTRKTLTFFGMSQRPEEPVTEEEIKGLIAEGTRNGTFEETEKEMVDNVFQLGDMKISGLLTPRTQVEWLDIEDSEENNLRIVLDSGDSWFIVARESLDEVLGIATAKDLLAGKLATNRLEVEKAVKAPLYVPKSVKVIRMLEMFKQSGNHIAFAIDEYGGFLGIVTLDDIMEEIVGDMVQQDAVDEPEIFSRDDGSWLIDGMLSIEEFKEFAEASELPGEERDHFQTLGGFVVSYLGYIPELGESFEWNEFRFEVVDMDRVRVDKVLVTKVASAENGEIILE
ncbi:MAG: hypothetical protein H6Q74_563 [Firmicutes bacterium]|nr:hypothetical protein [Bacillota bacterium]